MKICPNCQHQIDNDATFCTNCGAAFSAPQQEAQPAYAQPQQDQQQAYAQQPQQPYSQPAPNYAPAYAPYDHTAEFDATDISHNKVFAMLCYLTSLMGILIAVIAAQKSDYAMFHVRQALKFTVVEVLMALITIILCWTFIVPIAYGIMSVILWVIKVICVFQIGSGKAVEPSIIRSIGFLK